MYQHCISRAVGVLACFASRCAAPARVRVSCSALHVCVTVLLLIAGLDPSATDIHDREAQQYAGQHGAIFRLLRSAQASQKAAQHSKAAAAAKARARERAAARGAAAAAAAAAGAGTSGTGAVAAGGEVPQISPRGVTAGGAEEEQEDEEEEGSGVEVPAGRGSDALPPLLEQWQISPQHLVKGRLIEQGAFGAVYEGTWCGAKVSWSLLCKQL